jgi:sensor histidine kinase YesM
VDPLAYGLLLVSGRVLAAHERARRLELRESQLESQLTRAQLDALRLEIQPHFLFNTLNSIAALIRVHDHAGALSMLLGLSDLMRATLNEPAGHLAPLGHETEVIKQYVELQRIRFGDRLNVTYEVDAACEGIAIPTLLLQPLVENALRHGLAPHARPCHLVIGASQSRDRLRLWVSDDGAGLPAGFDLSRDAGTGLSNTRSRLERLYGQAATITIGPNPGGGAIVELVLPSTGIAQATVPATGAA